MKVKPFFIWAHYFDPHYPYEPPARLSDSFEDPYDGEVAFVDEQIGKLLAGLRKQGRLENTVTVITSDHGEGLGDHGEATHAFFLFDSTVKVPLIFHGPGLSGKRRFSGQVRSVDLRDAILSLLETAERPASDLAAYLRDPGHPLPDCPALSESLYCHRNFQWAQMTSLRLGEKKVIRGQRDDFFNPLQDPGETAPLAGEDQDEAWQGLAAEMDRLKSTARGRISKGEIFRSDLPGYVGRQCGRVAAIACDCQRRNTTT